MQASRTTAAPMPEERHNYGFKKSLEAVKAGVPLEDYASGFTTLERFGSDGWHKGRCPMPDHEDRDPSFYVYPEGRYYCFGCGAWGDVVDLCRELEGGELWTAMLTLAQRYGVELPRRPQRWHDWNSEKAKRRKKLRDVCAESYRRRFFRTFYSDYLAALEPEEREREGRSLYRDLWPVAVAAAEYRMFR